MIFKDYVWPLLSLLVAAIFVYRGALVLQKRYACKRLIGGLWNTVVQLVTQEEQWESSDVALRVFSQSREEVRPIVSELMAWADSDQKNALLEVWQIYHAGLLLDAYRQSEVKVETANVFAEMAGENEEPSPPLEQKDSAHAALMTHALSFINKVEDIFRRGVVSDYFNA